MATTIILLILLAFNLAVLIGIWNDIQGIRRTFSRLCTIVQRWDFDEEEEGDDDEY